MAWELLPVDYTDAVWAGLKRYNQINNEDGSVSFQDITSYTGKEKSFFGAKDANRMNEALPHCTVFARPGLIVLPRRVRSLLWRMRKPVQTRIPATRCLMVRVMLCTLRRASLYSLRIE